MSLFDIVVLVVAVAVGTWGAFGIVTLARRVWEMGGPVTWYKEMCFSFWYWRLRSERTAAYRPRHQPYAPTFMRAWDLL
jgi:hypothetical protein